MTINVLSMARRVRRHAVVKELMAAPRRWAVHATQTLNREVFAIEIEATSGFFATMQLVVFVLKHCDDHDLIPLISARGGLYGEPRREIDWFGALFEAVYSPSEAQRKRTRISRIRSVADLGFRQRYEPDLTLPMAHELFTKYLAIRPDILASARNLCRQLAITRQTLGVHYRGTDKIAEARRLSKEEFVEAVNAEIDANPELTNILLASDERDFIDFFLMQDLRLPVRLAPANYLSSAGNPVHFSNYPGLEIGREALMTCLLLSECGILVKTPSYLSAWAKIFNPALRVRLLADSKFFPDHALWVAQGTLLTSGRN